MYIIVMFIELFSCVVLVFSCMSISIYIYFIGTVCNIESSRKSNTWYMFTSLANKGDSDSEKGRNSSQECLALKFLN